MTLGIQQLEAEGMGYVTVDVVSGDLGKWIGIFWNGGGSGKG